METTLETFRIGTRKSQLALWQAEFVKAELEKAYPHMRVELVTMDTEGDRKLEVSLSSVAGKGFFTAEIEERLYNGQIDIAVHSLKDLPTELPEGLEIGTYCVREDPRDAFLSKDGVTHLEDLPQGAKVGTSSLRRIAQLRRFRPDIECVEIRGNLNTRWRKLQESEDLAGIILAAAGVIRLGWQDRITHFFDRSNLLSAPGQGIVAVEAASDREDVREILSVINHKPTELKARAERGFLSALGGGCQTPIAALAEVSEENTSISSAADATVSVGSAESENTTITLYGRVISLDGKACVNVEVSGNNPEEVGAEAARVALENGACDILATTCGNK